MRPVSLTNVLCVYLMSSLVSLSSLHCRSLGLSSVFPCDRWLQMPGRWASMGRSQRLLHSWHAFIFPVYCPQFRVFVLKQLCFSYLILNEQKPYMNHRKNVWICFTWVHVFVHLQWDSLGVSLVHPFPFLMYPTAIPVLWVQGVFPKCQYGKAWSPEGRWWEVLSVFKGQSSLGGS